MPLYSSIAEIAEEDLPEVTRISGGLMDLIQARHEMQVKKLEELNEYIPVYLILTSSKALSVWTVQHRSDDGITFLALAGLVTAMGPVVFVPFPHARRTIMNGEANYRAFIEGAYMWKRTT